MVAILYPRRLRELRDVTQPGVGLPDQGVPQLQSSNSSFVVETLAAGGAFSLGASNLGNTLGDTGITGSRVVLAGIGNLTLSQATDVNGGTITISGGSVAAGAFSAGASGGNTAGDTGVTGTRLVFAGGNSITLSQATDVNGGTITISGATTSQSAQTQGLFDLTIDGNTAGAGALVSSGTLTLAGGSNITLSQNGNAISILAASQSVQPETQTAISGIGNSQTTYTSGTVNLSALGALTIRSTTGNAFQFSVNSQSVQPETQTFIGGVIASNTTYTSGTVNMVGSGIVTVQSGTGQRVIINASQSVQAETQTFVGGVIASDTTYTSGSVRFTGVGGGVTVSSNTGQRVDISVAAPVAQTVQTQNVVDVTLSGNTAGALALVSSGTMTLAGGNNITVSQAGNAITISGANVGGAQTGISGLANSQTTYTSGTVSLSELGAITIRSTTGNQFQFSVNSQTAESQSLGMSNLGNTSGTTGIASGAQVRMLFAGGNNITLSQSLNGASGTITISGPNTVAQTNDSGGVYAVGNTYSSSSGTFDVRTLSIRGDGIISVAASNSGWRISASQSVQAETQTFVGGLAASNTTYTSGTITITGVGGGITVSSNTGQRIDLSVAAQTVESQSIGMSNIGNTSGTTGIASGGQVRFVFAGGNNITLSQSLNGASGTITISAPNLGAGAMSAGVSNLGNSAGATGITGTRLVLVGSDNITLSQTTDANGGTVSIIGPAAGGFSAGVSTGGNTAGDTGVSGTRMVLVGSGPVSLSQATAAAGNTVSINAPAVSSLVGTNGVSVSTNGSTISVMQLTVSSYAPYDESPMVTGQQGGGSLHISPVRVPNLQFDRIVLGMQVSNATNSSGSFTLSQWVGIYSRNANTLSLISSTSISTNFSGSGTAGSYSLYGGPKNLTIPWTMTLTGSDYWMGINSRTTSGGTDVSVSQLLLSKFTNVGWSGIMGAGSNASDQRLLGLGHFSVSTAGMPASVAFTDIRGTNSIVLRAPIYQFRSGTV